jgi:phenylpropionate dioxygenase-like ring-hydroxylating dioxygenase large terminal subunit
MTMFLRNAWYVAALDRELGSTPLAVRVLDEAIVLYRQSDGSAVALEDACPHRKLPLSMGRIKGDDIECGYHGLTFDCSGRCVRVPGADRIPPAARVRAYPIHQRYGLLWIWMGDADRADPATIYPVEHWGDPAWGVNESDAMTMACNYLYITDNLLDPSHVSWVHQTSFASSACAETPLEITLADSGITVWRWMNGDEPAPFYAPFLKFQGPVDRKQHYEVRYPCLALAKAVFAPAGTGGEGRELPPETFVMDSYNFLTPIDANTTRYYWFQMRNCAPGDAQVSKLFSDSVRAVFQEDKVILEKVHRGMAERRTPNIDLKIDTGPMRFRRRLAQLIEAEAGSQAAPTIAAALPVTVPVTAA